MEALAVAVDDKSAELNRGAEQAPNNAEVDAGVNAGSADVLNISELLQDRERLAGKIIVRTPVPEDREKARQLCRATHAQTVFGDIPFSDKKFDQLTDRVLARPRNGVALVAELNGEIIGVAWATAGEYLLCEGVFCATVHAIAVDQEYIGPLRRAKTFLRLIKGLKTWSKTRNAERLALHVTTGQKMTSTNRLLQAAGMRMVGGGYVGY